MKSIYLGRRNFHYLMSGLVLEESWDSDVAEYGVVNVTGLRMVDQNSDLTRTFLKRFVKN